MNRNAARVSQRLIVLSPIELKYFLISDIGTSLRKSRTSAVPPGAVRGASPQRSVRLGKVLERRAACQQVEAFVCEGHRRCIALTEVGLDAGFGGIPVRQLHHCPLTSSPVTRYAPPLAISSQVAGPGATSSTSPPCGNTVRTAGQGPEALHVLASALVIPARDGALHSKSPYPLIVAAVMLGVPFPQLVS